MKRRPTSNSAQAAKSVFDAGSRISGVGFGGFVGSTAVELGEDMDMLCLTGEYQAVLKQLSKRNATTKLKALQKLETMLEEEGGENLAKVMQPWVTAYRQLSRDLDRGVRQKSAEILQIFVTRLKRDLAPFLKGLMGPWWIAQHDVHRQTSEIAQAAFYGAFAGEKSTEAILHCRDELASYLAECLQSTPENIGDPLSGLFRDSPSDADVVCHRKESKEDRIQRHEFVLRAALHGTRKLAEKLKTTPKQDVVRRMLNEVGEVLLEKMLLKRILSSVFPSIRSEAFALVQQFCVLDREVFSDRHSSVSPLIFNCLGEKEASCHDSMWDLLLTFIKEFPEAWDHVNLEKAVIPKLCSFLRNAAFGSAEHSYNAVFPFLRQIPAKHWNGSPLFLVKAFRSAWEGMSLQQCTTSLTKVTLSLLLDCVLWGLLFATSLVLKEEVVLFRKELISGSLRQIVLPEVLGADSLLKECAMQLQTECMCTLASTASRTLENTTPHEVLHLLARTLVDDLIQRLDQEDADSVHEALCNWHMHLANSEQFNQKTKPLLLDVFASPIGAALTKRAFSVEEFSPSSALSLLQCSRAFDECLVRFQENKLVEGINLRIFHELTKLVGAVHDLCTLETLFDLLWLSLLKSSTTDLHQQWKTILLELERCEGHHPEPSSTLLLCLLTRLEVVLDAQGVPDLRTEEMDRLFVRHLDNRTRDPISGHICALLVKMQNILLGTPTYKTWLRTVKATDFSENLDKANQAPSTAMVHNFLSNASVKGLDDEGVQLWTDVALMLVRIGWGFESSSDAFTEVIRSAWNGGQCLKSMDKSIVEQLSNSLEDVLVTGAHSEIPVSVDATEWGFILADLISELMQIDGRDIGNLLVRVFGGTSWCRQWRETGDALEDAQELHDIFLQCAVKLILDHGASVFLQAPSMSAPAFVEVLSTSMDIAAAEESVLECIVQGVLTDEHSSIAVCLLERCLHLSLDSPKRSDFSYAAAVHSLLQALTPHRENVRVLRVFENFGRELGHYVRREAEELRDLASQEDRNEESDGTTAEFLCDIVSVIRMSSLVSVSNAELDPSSIHCIESCMKYSTASPGAPRSFNKAWNLMLLCFPLPLDGSDESQQLYTTPTEREAFLKLTYAPETCPDADRTELWRRCVVYASQDMSYSDWDAVFFQIDKNLEQECVKCEDVCEDVADRAMSCAVMVAPEGSITSPAMALEFLSHLPASLKLQLGSLTGEPSEEFTITAFMKWASLLVACIHSRPENLYWNTALNKRVRQSIGHCIRVVFCSTICTVAERRTASEDSKNPRFHHMSRESWDILLRLFMIAFEDSSLLTESVNGIDLWAETTGVDAISCLLELVFSPEHNAAFGSVGLKILASEACTEKLIMDVDLSNSDWEDRLTEHLEQGHTIDEAVYLKEAGVHPELVRCLKESSSDQLLLAWALLLIELESGEPAQRYQVSNLLRNFPLLIQRVLNRLVDHLPLLHSTQKRSETSQLELKRTIDKGVMQKEVFTLKQFLQSVGIPESEDEWSVLAMKMYHVMLVALPVSVRHWFNDLKPKHQVESIRQYTVVCESPQIIQNEFAQIADVNNASESDLKIHGRPITRDVVAKIEVEESKYIDLFITIPDCMPLKPMTIDCDMMVNVNHSQLRRWLFSVSAFLTNHSGTIVDAIGLWKKHVQELRNAQNCIICFCVLHPTSGRTPSLECKTCHLKFHSDCLYRWFRQSAKSLCPHCQNPWTA